MQLTFDPDVEAFRAEFVAFLDEHVPAAAAEALERPKSVSHMPDWARRWQRLLFDNGWLLPTQPPEFGGRNATVLQQYVYLEELCKRRIYHSFNPQGVNIIAASLISFGSDEQKQRWAVPILRAEITASLGMSEPSAGSDLASLRTKAVRDGDHFVVNGQKVWTSGAHDADVLLTFVRTDPDAPKHKGISALVIPTDTPGVTRRPFPDICGQDNLDFNEVFFEDAKVPAENLVGPLNQGWRVANGSLGHERTMMWLGFADRLDNVITDFHPANALERDHYATAIMDRRGASAARFGGAGQGCPRRRRRACAVGAQAARLGGRAAGVRKRLVCSGIRRLAAPGADRAVRADEPRPLLRQLVRALRPQLLGHHRRRHLGNPAQHHRPASARAARALKVATSVPDETERPAGGPARRATTAGVERGVHRTGQRHRVPRIGVVRWQEVDRAAHTVGHVDDHRVAAIGQMCPASHGVAWPLGLGWACILEAVSGVTWLARPDCP